MDTLAQDPYAWIFFDGYVLHVGWQIKPGTGQERMKIVLLNGAEMPLRTLASGIANKFANMGQADANYWYNIYPWTLGPGDVGCYYKIRVSTEDNSMSITSAIFNIYPALNYQKNGVYSYARLDTPQGGVIYFLNRDLDIKWTAMAKPTAWPSKEIQLKLMANDNGNIVYVGDIAHVGINFIHCPIHGKYSWKVGSLLTCVLPEKRPDGKNGIRYRIRLTGDTSTYDSDDFLIGRLLMPKVPVNK
jgi:hypothetical protein